MPGGDDPAPSAAAPSPTSGDRLPRPRRRRSWRSRALLAAVMLMVACGAWTVVTGLVAAHRLSDVRADLEGLTHQPGDRETLKRHLAADLVKVRSVNGLLDQPGPSIIGALPLVGRNVRAEQTVARASAAALEAGLTLTRATDGLNDGRGGVDLTRLRAASTELAAAATALRGPLTGLARVHVGWTLPPVQTGVRQARDQLLGLDDRLQRGADALAGLSGVLGGSGRRTVLVGLMNNAELRGAGGLLSAYAVGSTDHGRLALHPFRDVNEVAASRGKARRVAAPADYHAAYGPYLGDTTLWKNVTMSARADESAEVLANVASASVGVHPDVVVLCDVPAAAGVISATGPITVAGQPVSGAELTRRLLVDAYGDGSLSQAKQRARREALTSAATQAFDRLRHEASSTPALLQALSDATAGRHLTVWSSRPAEERLLVAAGLGGAVDARGSDIAMPVTNNLGDSRNLGNKLDYYIDRHVGVDVRLQTGSATVVQTLTLHNAAPLGLGPYVNGVEHPGEVSELLSMEAASAATLTSFTRDGIPQDVTVDRADGAQRLTTVLQLPRGESTTYRLSYTLPLVNGRYRLLLVPQALAKPAQLHVRIHAVDATLGIASGIQQPRGDEINVSQAWNSWRAITVPVHRLSGVRGALHAIADFWNHKVEF